MVRTVKRHVDRHCESPFCIGMTLLAAVFATALVIYSAAEILVLLR
jgi:hypothetical protein